MRSTPPADVQDRFVRGPFTHMTFDEQVRRAVDTLTERLHDDVRREVEIAVEEVTAAHNAREAELTREIDAIRASVAAEIETARRSAARETEEAREALVREKDAAVALSAEQSATAARAAAAAEAANLTRGAQSAAAERLLDAVRSIGGARSLSETLDTLASSAAREAERAAVLTVRAGELRGWRFIGF